MILDIAETQPAEPVIRRKPRTVKPKTKGARPASRPALARKPAALSSGALMADSPKESSLASSVSHVPNNNLWTSFLQYFRKLRAPQKRLRVCESVSLGDKRFLAIVRVDSESFLLGGSTGSVSMLAKLNDPGTFSAALQQQSVGAGSLQ